MEISNLNYFVERIVDLSTSNQVLCEQRREFEDKIEKMEEHIALLKKACSEKDERIDELESLEQFNPEEVPDCPTEFTLHNVDYFQNSQGFFMTANDGNETFSVEITHQEYLDGVNQYLRTLE